MAQAREPVKLGIDAEALRRDLVGHASGAPGIERSDFSIERACQQAEALVLDQTNFALGAQGFAIFQDLVDNPPTATTSLRRTLTSRAPWDATAVAMGKSTPEL